MNALMAPVLTAFSNSQNSQYSALETQIAAAAAAASGANVVHSLWAPGAPQIGTWTELNPAGDVPLSYAQNGTKGCTIICGEQSPASSIGMQWAGYCITAPTAPYKVVLGFKSIVSAYAKTVGSSVVDVSGNPIGIGWTDGSTAAFWYTQSALNGGSYDTLNYTTDLTGFLSQSINSTYQFTDSHRNFISPVDSMYILSNDGTNITISETIDGVTEHVIFTAPIATGFGTAGATMVGKILITFGANSYANNGDPTGTDAIGGSMTNLYLYDPAGASRLVLAPGY